MKHVVVTFYLEADDLEHETGVSEPRFDHIMATIASLGGYDVELEVEEEETAPVARRPKPLK